VKAIVYTEYGPPSEVVQLQEAEKPTPEADQVLVKIRATSVCWADEAYIRGEPFLARLSNGLQKPTHTRPGMDIAGQVEAVGATVGGSSQATRYSGTSVGVSTAHSPSM
jgi:NADPH:quinone reductase-like Zn-dependent oxidoreductase